jgi:hypothetical protein
MCFITWNASFRTASWGGFPKWESPPRCPTTALIVHNRRYKTAARNTERSRRKRRDDLYSWRYLDLMRARALQTPSAAGDRWEPSPVASYARPSGCIPCGMAYVPAEFTQSGARDSSHGTERGVCHVLGLVVIPRTHEPSHRDAVARHWGRTRPFPGPSQAVARAWPALRALTGGPLEWW